MVCIHNCGVSEGWKEESNFSSGPFIRCINWRSQYFSREIPAPKEDVDKLKTLVEGSENVACPRKVERADNITSKSRQQNVSNLLTPS